MKEYQLQRIKLIKEILPLLGDRFVLKGGTALSLYYNLNRYSEDIDLDSITNNKNIINKLKSHKDFKNWNVSIKKDTDTTFRVMIDYGGKNDSGGNYPLKIEVSSRMQLELKNKILTYQNIDGVNVYNIKELCDMKLNAFNNRDKVRDFYDIGFLIKNHNECFDDRMKISIKEKIYYFGEEELNLLLKDEIKNHHLNGNFKTKNYAQEILDNLYKNKVAQEKEFLDNAFAKLKPDLKSIKPNESAKNSVKEFVNGLKWQGKDKGFER